MNRLYKARGLPAIAGIVAMALAYSSGISRADEVVLDDQIVQGSQCVGFDCDEDEVLGWFF